MQQLGGHGRDGIILGTGWVGVEQSVRSDHHIGGDRMWSKGL